MCRSMRELYILQNAGISAVYHTQIVIAHQYGGCSMTILRLTIARAVSENPSGAFQVLVAEPRVCEEDSRLSYATYSRPT